MCCNNNEFDGFIKGSFQVENPETDTVVSVGSGDYSAIAPTINALADKDPNFWVEPDVNGVNQLCAVMQPGKPLEGSFNDGATTYYLKLVPFVGGRPDDHIRK